MKLKGIIFISVLFLCLPLISEAALRNYSGFETGDTNEANATSGTIAIMSTSTRSSGYALRVFPATTATGYYQLAPLSSNGAQSAQATCTEPCAIGFWFYAKTLPSSGEEIIARLSDNSAAIASVTIRSDGKLAFYDSAGTSRGLGTSTTALSGETWYFIEAKAGSAASLAYGVRINGSEEISGTDTLGGSSVQTVSFGKVANMNSNSVDFYYDDLYFNDSGYLSNAQNGKILRLYPDSNGSAAVGQSSTAFRSVDEVVTDGDTTAITVSSGASYYLNHMADMVDLGIPTNSFVHAFKGLVRSKGNSSATATSSIRIRANGGVSDTSTTTLLTGGTYFMRAKVQETDPGTGVAWTYSGIDQVELGVNSDASNSLAISYTTGWGMVYYTPASTSILSNFGYCREVTMTVGGGSGGAATTTTNGFVLFASTTLATLAATSSGGNIQSVTLATSTMPEHPRDFIVTSDGNCDFSTGTLLDHFVESYSSTTGAIGFWHENMDISSTTAKDVNIYYGYSTTTELQNKQGMWGALRERAVYGLFEAPAVSYPAEDFLDGTYNSHHASSTGGMNSGSVDGQLGKAMSFDGSNDLINTQSSTLINAEQTVTIAAWVRMTGSGSWPAAVAKTNEWVEAGSEYVLGTSNNTRKPEFIVAGWVTLSNNALSLNTWYHLVAVNSSAGCAIYVNGALDTSCSAKNAPASTADTWKIGTYISTAASGQWPGYIDDVRIYRNDLHSMDVLTIYNNTKSSSVFWTFGAEQTPGSPGMTQLHYRFRNDDGSESGATWAVAEDTALTSNFFPGDRKRLRFLISSTGGAATGNITYKLEHASSSCTTWVPVPATSSLMSEHFVIDTSSHFSDGASTTDSAGLSNPDGKTFSAGMAKSAGNSTNAIALTTSQFTELEYTIKPTSNVSIGTTYCFRLTNGGSTTGFTYTAQPQVAVSAVASRPTGGGSSAVSPGEGSGSGSVQTGGTVGGGGTTTTPGGEGSGSGTPRGGGGTGGGGGDVGFLLGDRYLASLSFSSKILDTFSLGAQFLWNQILGVVAGGVVLIMGKLK